MSEINDPGFLRVNRLGHMMMTLAGVFLAGVFSVAAIGLLP